MIAGVILAAGGSSRMGRPKQLLPLAGRPVLQHVVDAALAAELDDVIVVLGHAADDVRAALDLRPPARAVVNPDHALGQSSSLRAGLRAAEPGVRAAIVLLGDQPEVTAAAIRSVIAAYGRTGGPIVRAVYGDRPGHPVLFDRSVWPEVEALEGDRGARSVVVRDPDRVVEVPFDCEPPGDLDTWSDYEHLSRRLGG